MMPRGGITIKITSGIFGALMFLGAVFFLNEKDILQAGIFAIIGILLIVISVFPYMKGKIKGR